MIIRDRALLITVFIFTFAISALTQSGWYIAYSPTAGRIDDISFINDSVGYMKVNTWIYQTRNGGKSWGGIAQIPFDFYVRSIEFLDEQVGILGGLAGSLPPVLMITKDGGQNFTNLADSVDGGFIGMCGIDSKDSLVIGVGIYLSPAKFYKSVDRGYHWKSWDVPKAGGLVDCVILNDSTFLVSGFNERDSLSQASIYKTTDGGLTWTRKYSAPESYSFAWKLFDDGNGKIYGSIERGSEIVMSVDQGDTWKSLPLGLNYYESGAIGFWNDSLGWVGDQHNNGMFETRDGGKTWELINVGQRLNRMVKLKNHMVAVGDRVYIYEPGTSQVLPPIEKQPFHTLNIYPNPASNEINIDLELLTTTQFKLELIDSQGRIVDLLWKDRNKPGKHHLKKDLSRYPPGNYSLWLRTNEGHLMKHFVLTR
jgi:photosystem II stability/assembly factor-like uncharacterized protein